MEKAGGPTEHLRAGALVLLALVPALGGCHASTTLTGDAGTGDAGARSDAAPADTGPAEDGGEDWGFDASFIFDRDAGPDETSPYPHVIYLNTSGRAWAGPFVADGPAEVPAFMRISHDVAPADAFSPGWQARRAVVIDAMASGVAARFDGLDVVVTTRRPPLDGYIEVLVGGDDADRGEASPCSDRIGFAHLLCGTVGHDERRVGHVLSSCMHTADGSELSERLASVAAHEVGHSVGLEHIDALGVIMSATGSSGADRWGRGLVVPFEEGMSDVPDRGDCGRVSQDSRMVLGIQLGAARPRDPVPPPLDDTPPRFTARPHDGDRVPPGAELCARVESEDDLAGAIHLEVFLELPGDGDLVRMAHDFADGPAPRFAALPDVPLGATLHLRLTAADVHGNLVDERMRVVVDDTVGADCD